MPEPQQPQTVDYDKLAAQARSSSGPDYDALAKKAVDTPSTSSPGWLQSLFTEATQSIRTMPGATLDLVKRNLSPDPFQTIGNVVADVGSHAFDPSLEQKASEAFKKGDYVTGTRHVINWLTPFIGTRMDQAGDYAAQGEYAKSAGATVDAATQAFGPKVIADTMPAVEAALKSRQLAKPTQAASKLSVDLMKAVPPSTTTPYTVTDLQRVTPYLSAEHAGSPISTVEGLRDAADSAITQIEEHVHKYISANPTDTIRTNPLQSARAALSLSPRSTALSDGMKELSDLGLDKDVTVQQADAIRLQLNAENKAVLKRNNYDVATARKVDPGFVAREVAAKALRDGIYQQLEERGIPDVQQLRLDEGALISLRNAAQRQAFSGDKAVSGTGSSTTRAKLTRAVVPAATGAAGAYLAGPVGAASGAVVGNEIARSLAPSNLTRDALVERAFKDLPSSAPNYPAVPPPSPVRGLLPSHPIELPAKPDTSGMTVTRAARGLVVRDPVTGRYKRVYTSESVQPMSSHGGGQ